MSSRAVSEKSLAPTDRHELAGEDGSEKVEQVTRNWWDLAFFTLASLMALLLVVRLFYIHFPPDQYVELARSLAQGRLNVDQLPANYIDTITWDGHKYLPFGPLPALLLIPFLPLIDAGMDVGVVSLLLTAFNIWLLWDALGKMSISDSRRKWAVLLFFAGTSYFASTLVPTSAWFAHLVVTSGALLAIRETMGQRRPVLMGLFLGLAAMTRLTSVMALPFFVWLLLFERLPASKPQAQHTRQARLVQLALGLVGPILLLLAYNYFRFGSPLQTGYGLALLGSTTLEQAMAHGLFSLEHIPKNLFMLLLQGPLPYPSADAPVLQFPYVQFSKWGMGIFFVSPALLLAFRARLNSRLVQACWLAIVCVLVPLITYYGIGWYQFGYRYALDFMPFLLLLAVLGFRAPIDNRAKALIVASVLINLWGALWIITWM